MFEASLYTSILNTLTVWGVEHGVRILGILIGAWLIRKFVDVFIEKIVRRAVPPNAFLSADAEKKREDTLIHITSGTVRTLIWLVVGMMILSEFGVDIAPILAAAGVAGLALGFGGQYLIRDVISGLFVILENQYRVGDVVCFNKTCGVVESVSLRMTVLRDLDATVHHVPHGEIGTVSNLSKGFARVNLDIGISYSADLEKVIEVVNQVGKELAEDSE
jgi:moderate conductance mechanosensitive channel